MLGLKFSKFVIFQGKHILSTLSVRSLEDTGLYKNAFEIAGTHTEPMVAICQTVNDRQQWVELLQPLTRNAQSPIPPTPPAHVSIKNFSRNNVAY